jgi:hypothetical protein
MRLTVRDLLLLIAVAMLSGTAWGDGKFFVRENVPADVPYQRAILLFHGGSETLVLQSKFDVGESAAVATLGWVVPVPAVPEVASADPGIAEQCFRLAAWRTQPRLFRISSLFALIPLGLFVGGLGFLLFCAVQYPFVRNVPAARDAWSRRCGMGTFVTFLGFLSMAFLLPSLGMTRGAARAGRVDVLKAERVGIYDVKVIRGDSAEAITGWLKDNGFGFADSDLQVFQGYVGRGWCFAAAKVDPNQATDTAKVTRGGLVAPLIFQFTSERPLYPLALTATVGTETEMLLYTLSDDKLTCGGRLTLRHAGQGKPQDVLKSLVATAAVEEWPVFQNLPETPMMLCKFKGRLTAAQMQEDLAFEPAADNEPYRERKTVW